MKRLLLTDEEIYRAAIEEDSSIFIDATDVSELDRAIAEAQLAKVAMWAQSMAAAAAQANDMVASGAYEELWRELRGVQ